MAIFAISMPLRCRWSRCEPVVGGPEQETPAIPAYRAAPRLRSTSRRCRWVSRSIPASMKRRLLALSLSGKPLLSRLLSGSGVDDPDAYFFEHYACGSERNYTNYCNPGLEKMYEQQSIEPDQTKRKQLVWEIDRRLQEDAARPMIFNYRLGTCRSPVVHGITIMVNSLFNGWRFEDAWLGQ